MIAIARVLGAVEVAGNIPRGAVGPDDDFVDDVGLKFDELISLRLIVEEVFSIDCPDDLFKTGWHRTAAALSEWIAAKVGERSWRDLQQQRRRA